MGLILAAEYMIVVKSGKGFSWTLLLQPDRSQICLPIRAVLKAYKLLGREDRGVLKQAGFEQYLQKLPREWKKGYGVYEEENSSGVILSVILAGVFLLAGVGVEVLCGLFYENIGAQLMMILGVVFSAIGAAGILIVLICMMISGRRESSDR